MITRRPDLAAAATRTGAAAFWLMMAAAPIAGAQADPTAAGRPDLASAAGESRPLLALYEELHRNPELSFKERRTSLVLAAELKALGFDVTAGLGHAWVVERAETEAGRLREGVGGYGLVAVLHNGQGPTVLVRTDMDALPVTERTGLPYASSVRDTTWTGEEGGVMHACGHDMHMTSWVGTARELVARRSEWAGTLLMLAQPAEELGMGASAMLADGLFERFGRPDFNLALHASASLPAGTVGYTSGFAMANVDSVDILVKGVGGHGAYPHAAKDPVVVAARIVSTLQTLVSRELDPREAGVVTVGSIHGGSKRNVIPDEVTLELTVRSYSDPTRAALLEGIERIAVAEALAAGLSAELAPVVRVRSEYTPAVYNDPPLTERIMAAVAAVIGEHNVRPLPPSMAGEDFARYGRVSPAIPSLLFWVGAVRPVHYEASKSQAATELPSLHSSLFAPDPAATIATAVEAMTAAVLALLGR